MIEIFDFNNWDIYEGASEGSGRSEKIWLTYKETNQIGLFKYPKNKDTTEYISEKLASDLAKIIGVECVKVDIGIRDNRIGCLSYRINNEKINLIEGVNLINLKRPNFNPKKLYDEYNDEYYSIEMIFDSVRNARLRTELIKMMIFDALIGNSDRHQSNWAVLYYWEEKKIIFCPLYDNGSSLCSYVCNDQVDDYLKDKTRFNSLIDSKSRSRIRIDSKAKKEPSHKEVLLYIKEKFLNDEIKNFIETIIKELTLEEIKNILDEYNDNMLPKNKKILISNFLIKKIDLINGIFI